MDIPGDLDPPEWLLAPLNQPHAKNWVSEQGGLPSYIDRIKKHLIAKGMTESHAIAVSVNAARRMCSSGDVNWPGIQRVNPGSRAEACAAIARWDSMRARARAS